jgi:hypothetical protein
MLNDDECPDLERRWQDDHRVHQFSPDRELASGDASDKGHRYHNVT